METKCEKLQLCDLHTDHPHYYDTHNVQYITVYTPTTHSLAIVHYLATRFLRSYIICVTITHTLGRNWLSDNKRQQSVCGV